MQKTLIEVRFQPRILKTALHFHEIITCIVMYQTTETKQPIQLDLNKQSVWWEKMKNRTILYQQCQGNSRWCNEQCNMMLLVVLLIWVIEWAYLWIFRFKLAGSLHSSYYYLLLIFRQAFFFEICEPQKKNLHHRVYLLTRWTIGSKRMHLKNHIPWELGFLRACHTRSLLY